MACSTSAVVCSIGDLLVPEFPHPTPINDSLDGLLAVLDSKVSVSDRQRRNRNEQSGNVGHFGRWLHGSTNGKAYDTQGSGS